MVEFSLIIGTLNRTKELQACLESIKLQICDSYEIIIVDQSDNNKTRELVEKSSDGRIKYIYTDIKGLSHARNIGIKEASGKYLCLLDDDAVYPPQYLETIKNLIGEDRIVSGVIFSIDDYKTPFINYQKCLDGKEMSVTRIVEACPSAALAFPRNLVLQIGGFNECLGVGNEFAAGEETEFLLRALDARYSVIHSKKTIAYHPIKPVDYSNLKGVYKHAMGKGALYKIECKRGHKIRLLLFAMKNTIGMIIKMFLERDKKSFYKARYSGFANGYRSFK